MDTIYLIISYMIGVITTAFIYSTLMVKYFGNKTEVKKRVVEDMKFPKVWELAYSTPSYFKIVIDPLVQKYLLGKGNLAEFIRLIPFNTDGFHVGCITITFHLVERGYSKDGRVKAKQLRHSVILKRGDVVPESIVEDEVRNEQLST